LHFLLLYQPLLGDYLHFLNILKSWQNNLNPSINTENTSSILRGKAIDLNRKAILITNLGGSEQERDLTEPINCNGFGRIRHFRLDAGKDWIQNPLPILPASKALGLQPSSQIRAQVFQSSVCNWRCWFCFVDYKLLKGDSKYAAFLTSEEMINLYLNDRNPSPMIDLTGGHPDLTPEWIPWMMQALREKGLDNKIFLWSDDNLSNDYLWRFLKDEQIDLMSSYKMYSRVCCFKGIDKETFSLNTKANPNLFLNQFEIFKRLLELNLDLYCYIILVANSNTNFKLKIPQFLDMAQSIDELLPLRILPLKVFNIYSPTSTRIDEKLEDMFNGQFIALEIWKKEIMKRFSTEQLLLPITEIKLKKHN
jgi:uncharacterized Fe-S cluster-containing radical SAM superfamily protein